MSGGSLKVSTMSQSPLPIPSAFDPFRKHWIPSQVDQVCVCVSLTLAVDQTSHKQGFGFEWRTTAEAHFKQTQTGIVKWSVLLESPKTVVWKRMQQKETSTSSPQSVLGLCNFDKAWFHWYTRLDIHVPHTLPPYFKAFSRVTSSVFDYHQALWCLQLQQLEKLGVIQVCVVKWR